MNDFTLWLPTKVYFGRDAETKAGEAASLFGAKKVLIVFGGGSAKKSGLIGRVEESLEASGIGYEEFGGAKPNPTLAHAEEGVKKALEMQADLILAVGGGSAIDTAKAIAHGAANKDQSLWDLWTKKVPLERSLAVGAVLTIPAAGSDMSDSAVLTNEALGVKAGINTDFNRCRFALLNPANCATLPKYQLAAGITDIMMHTMERYFIKDVKCDLTDELAEGLLRAVIKNARILMIDKNDYDAMAEIMWANSLSHNNLTECGRGKDFSVHKLGHALSAKYDSTHGASLAAVWGSWARFQMEEGLERFARFARKVFRVEDQDDRSAAKEGIARMEEFLKEIGMPVSLKELGVEPDDSEIEELAKAATGGGSLKLSRLIPLDTEAVRKIFTDARA
ncbi:MAG: iron-containing alcohol dehydrogenase [Lachnospiraceae bacterium]|nr:iron-containing alcohol dehydrogenase [Lachnospiraceae bacterium]